MYERIRDRLRPMTSMKSSATEQGSREQLREREKSCGEKMESAVRVGLLLLLVVVKSQCPNGAGDVDAGLSSSASPYQTLIKLLENG